MDLTTVNEGIQLLALRPGDRLAIRFPPDYSYEEVVEMQGVLKGVWPEISPAFFSNEIELSVIRSEES